MSDTLRKIQERKKVTVEDVAVELDTLKSANDYQHTQMRERMDQLQADVKENRKFFEDKFKHLDNRIWWIMGFTVSTLLAIVADKVI